MTRFFRGLLEYRPVIGTRPIDVTKTHRLDVAYGLMLTLPERHARDDEITAHMYRLQILQLTVGGRPSTREEIRIVELDYPLGHNARTLLRIGPNFVKLVDDDMPTEEE